MANRIPMQLRGPCPKGKKAYLKEMIILQLFSVFKCYTLGQKSTFHPKSHIIQEIHIFQIALLAKFTFLRSHFKNRIFHKNHISEVHISQKIAFLQPIFHKKRIFKISCSA